MNENDTAAGMPSGPQGTAGTTAESELGTSRAVPGRLRSKLRWFLLRASALAGAFLLLLALLTAFAGMYTSRPEFCRSCHNMEPYYVSWQNSSHKDVSCVKCHFPPGVGEKLRGKLLGLVQLAKYVTSSEGPRPAAEVPDESCLRSGCHETRLLAGRVEFQGVAFDHRPHLQEMRRGKKLRCTSCHSQIVQGSHMTVTTSTCFLCHFKDGYLNEGLGACTRCHQIPEKDLDLGGGISFDHDLVYRRGIDCANCHGDLIRGNGEVPHERCGVCHNREDDLKKIGDHEFLHRKHVTDHKVDCLECHLSILHSLDAHKVRHAASDCESCHPGHHREQVDMLHGVGGKATLGEVDSTVVARIACRSCHEVKKVSSTGAVLWTASTDVCANCHDDSTTQKHVSYCETLQAALPNIEACAQRARQALESANLDAEQRATDAAQLDRLQDDLEFLRVGNGVHNIHYANTLTRELLKELSSLCRRLQIDEPEVTLPEEMEPPK